MENWKLLLIIGFGAVQICRNENFRVVKFYLNTTEQVNMVSSFLKNSSVDMLFPVSTAYPNFAYVLRNVSKKLLKVFQELKVNYTLIDTNKLIAMEKQANDKAKSRVLSRFRTSCWPSIRGYFARYAEINAWMDDIANCESLASVLSIGKSFELRDVRALKISAQENSETAIVVTSGVHGREWLPVASLVYLIERIIEKYRSGEERVQRLLRSFDIYFIPIMNPDGYEFTFTDFQNRLWRKTRQPWNGTMGVDFNRNFDIDFTGPGSSASTSDDDHRGPFPFSEPETANFRDFIWPLREKVKLYIDFHAFGLMWLLPKKVPGTPSADEADLRRVAFIGVEAIYSVNKTKYSVGTCAELLYNVSGASFDWMYHVAKVKYSYAVELRPKTKFIAFLPPPASIQVTGEEVFAAVLAIATDIAGK